VGAGRPVIELEDGVTVYPARFDGDRWRAVWYEDGERRQCVARSEDRLAGKLARVAERLAADAPKMRRPGAHLIAWYLDLDRLPAERRWSRKHADTQRRLCARFAVPVIGTLTCQDIKTRHTQAIVDAAPTAGEGERVRRMIGPGQRGPGRRLPRQPPALPGALAGREPCSADQPPDDTTNGPTQSPWPWAA
jgi:hypothetical protein